MSTTVDKSLYKRAQCFGKDTANPNTNYRQTSVFQTTRKLTRTRTGESNPSWKQQVHDLKNATTNMSGSYSSVQSSRGSISLVFDKPGVRNGIESFCYGDIALYHTAEPFWSGLWTSYAGSRASAKAYSEVRSAQMKVSGPTFLGELRETLQMFRKPAAALNDGIKDYLRDLALANRANRRKYYNKQKARYTKNVASIAAGLWLERAFGWDPLIQDLQGARDAFNDLTEVDRVVKFSASGKDGKLLSLGKAQLNVNPPSSYNSFQRSRKDDEWEVVRYRGAVKARAATTARDKLARFGFTPSEFVPTAWELLPWSFLADYFVNIGDIINCSVTDLADVVWVNRTVRRVVQRWDLLTPNHVAITATLGLKNIHTMNSSPSQVVWRKSTVSRVAHTGIDFPVLTFKLAQSPMHLANIAALLQSVTFGIHPQNPSRRNYRL